MTNVVADVRSRLSDGAPTVVLTQASTSTELELITAWVQATPGLRPLDTLCAPLGPNAPNHGQSPAEFTTLRHLAPDVRLLPLRVAWLPEERKGRRSARLIDLLPGQDPYHPTERRQRRLAAEPGRAVVLAGEPATVAELRERWLDVTGGESGADFAAYVIRRATLALDRAEYQLRGPRYRTPSLVKDEILSAARFRRGLSRVPGSPSLADAETILDEMAAGWSRRLIDIVPTTGRLIYRRGFDTHIDFDDAQVDRLRAAMERHPGILLWSHRSNLDNLVLTAAMQEKGLPPAHLFAGINMAFGPMGAIFRRAGVIFIRRSIGNDALYKYVLKEYVGYVLEKRFNLSWSIEGTRSRTGKMLPPRLGLLSYAADAYLDGRADDIQMLPVSIAYDELHEIAEYADYARGGDKQPEGFGWLLRFIKAQGARHYGKLYVRFGEPVSLRSFMGEPAGPIATDPATKRLALQKTAFEVAWRINQEMPVTATALVSTLLLGVHGTALTFDEVRRSLTDLLHYLDERAVPRTASLRALSSAEGLRATLSALTHGGLVSRVDGREPVWAIDADQQLPAAFYRNSLIHFFLDTALCELALLAADDSTGDRLDAFWAEITRLRDLLKFEFYFKDRDTHRQQILEEMKRHEPSWEHRVVDGDAVGLLTGIRPLVSHVVLRPFLEAYSVLADVLATHPRVDADGAIRDALELGRQYVAQRRLRSAEPVSVLLFRTALDLAANQGLMHRDEATQERREVFRGELETVLSRLDRVEHIAVKRLSPHGSGVS